MSTPSTPSPLLNRWLPIAFLILAAVGVPAVAVVSFTHYVVTEHPLLATLIGLLYEAILLVLAFLGKVWGRIEDRWVGRSADWIDNHLLMVFSRYHRNYSGYLLDQHRDFDIKGLTLQGRYSFELDQVFVELNIHPTTVKEMSVNPIPIPSELVEGTHSIWEYLASVPLTKQSLVIVGPPGSGKTTLLKHITLALLTPGKSRSQNYARLPHRLPILLFLRDHATAIHISENKETPNFTLEGALHDHLKKWQQPDPPDGWIRRQLSRGRCLIMLDGLDEVADPQIRQEVVKWVQKQIVAYRKNRFVITSRPFGIKSNPLSGVAVLQVRPFTSTQVERFVHKWYLADEIMRKQKIDSGVRMRASTEAKSLLRQLDDTPNLRALTVNPLLLTMITIVHRYGGGGKLPEKRVSLYEDICKVFLGKRQEARDQVLQLKPDQTQLVLQPLAYEMMKEGSREITPALAKSMIAPVLARVNPQMSTEDFLSFVENVSGLLLAQETDIYMFAHKTFQEYLAAIYIHDNHLGQELISRVGNVWWQETIRLYCAQADATAVIQACLEGGHPSISKLLLALDCLREAREVQPEVKDEVEHLLAQGMEDTDPERQHIVAEVLLTRRLRNMRQLTEDTFVDSSFITCGEYQVFLDEQRERKRYFQPDHWMDYRFSPGGSHNPVLGVRPSDAAEFCAWLTEREQEPWQYRLPKQGELKQVAAEDILHGLPLHTGYWLHQRGEFAWTGEPVSLQGNGLQDIIARARAGDFARARALDLDGARARARARALNLDRALALARALNLDLDLALDRKDNKGPLFQRLTQRLFPLFKKGQYQHDEDVINRLLDTYIMLVILEERQKGNLFPFEGILIVKERQQVEA